MAEEDFDIQTLATVLHLTPAQVEKMAGRGQLPGRRIGGAWRFSRSEIHHWFEDRIGLSDEAELVQVEKVLDSSKTQTEDSVANLLTPDTIWIPLPARTRNSVISVMCNSAADAGLVWDSAKMESAIKSRESLHPTALENGVAMLHPRRPQHSNISHAFVALGITTNGLPFGGPRGVMTDIFFLLASANEGDHLRTLARLSRIIALPGFVDELRESGTAQTAHELIKSADQSIN